VVLNFGDKPGCFSNPLDAPAKKIFDSSEENWMGPGDISAKQIKAREKFSIHPQAAVIYEP
jgi:hypothetical protein